MVALEANCSYLLSREIIIVGRHPLRATSSDLPECSQRMDEPGREWGPGHSCNEALLWLQSFLWDSLSGWLKFSELCFSSPILLPSLCPFSDVTPAPSLKAPYTSLLLLGLPVTFICIPPYITFGNLILSYLFYFLEDLGWHSKNSIISVCLIKQLYSQIESLLFGFDLLWWDMSW